MNTMEFKDEVQQFAKRVDRLLPQIKTEEDGYCSIEIDHTELETDFECFLSLQRKVS